MDLPLQTTGGSVEVLLGLDHAHLMIVEETRRSKDYKPIASKTRLGWVVRGVTGASRSFGNVLHSWCEEENNLAASKRRFCEMDSFETEHQSECVSTENKLAIDTLEAGLRKLSTGYEAPIHRKDGSPVFSTTEYKQRSDIEVQLTV